MGGIAGGMRFSYQCEIGYDHVLYSTYNKVLDNTPKIACNPAFLG